MKYEDPLYKELKRIVRSNKQMVIVEKGEERRGMSVSVLTLGRSFPTH